MYTLKEVVLVIRERLAGNVVYVPKIGWFTKNHDEWTLTEIQKIQSMIKAEHLNLFSNWMVPSIRVSDLEPFLTPDEESTKLIVSNWYRKTYTDIKDDPSQGLPYIGPDGMVHIEAWLITDNKVYFNCPVCYNRYRKDGIPHANAMHLVHVHSFETLDCFNMEDQCVSRGWYKMENGYYIHITTRTRIEMTQPIINPEL